MLKTFVHVIQDLEPLISSVGPTELKIVIHVIPGIIYRSIYVLKTSVHVNWETELLGSTV